MKSCFKKSKSGSHRFTAFKNEFKVNAVILSLTNMMQHSFSWCMLTVFAAKSIKYCLNQKSIYIIESRKTRTVESGWIFLQRLQQRFQFGRRVLRNFLCRAHLDHVLFQNAAYGRQNRYAIRMIPFDLGVSRHFQPFELHCGHQRRQRCAVRAQLYRSPHYRLQQFNDFLLFLKSHETKFSKPKIVFWKEKN